MQFSAFELAYIISAAPYRARVTINIIVVIVAIVVIVGTCHDDT